MKKYVKIALLTLSILTVRILNYAQSVSNTGQTSIAVPIHTVQDGSAVVPIALSYDHSGVKPDVHPGWVGQNWNLAAGGMITRVVRDIPDDFDGNIYLPSPKKYKITTEGSGNERLFLPLKRRMLGITRNYSIANPVPFPSIYPIPFVDYSFGKGILGFYSGNALDCTNQDEINYYNNIDGVRTTDRDIFFNKTLDWNVNDKFMFASNLSLFFEKGSLYQFKLVDTEPDDYYFSLPNGQNGKFFYDMFTRQWVVQGSKTIKVEQVGRLAVPFTPPASQFTGYKTSDDRSIIPALFGFNDTKVRNVRRTMTVFDGDVTPGTGQNRGFASWTFMVEDYSDTFAGFKITTDDGTVFNFGGNINSIQYGMGVFYQAHNFWNADAWYLTNIKSPENRNIDLVYEEYIDKSPGGKIVGSRFTCDMFMTAGFNKNTFYYPNTRKTSYQEYSSSISYPIGVYSGNLIRPVYLKYIKSTTDSIVFNKSRSVEKEYPNYVFSKFKQFWQNETWQGTTRFEDGNRVFGTPSASKDSWCPFAGEIASVRNADTDDPNNDYANPVKSFNWPKLDSIEVFNKSSTGSVKVANYILTFNNSNIKYTYAVPEGNPLYRYNHFNDRLKLLKIERVAPKLNSLATSFQYQTAVKQPINYLDTLGLVDHWGYYNGKKLNIGRILSLNDLRLYNYFNYRQPSTNIDTTKSEVLKSITLPTCGRIEYEFEQNDYSRKYNRDSCYIGSAIVRGNLTNGIKICTDKNSIDSLALTKTGGLRLKTILYYDEKNNIVNSKLYSYQQNYGKSNTSVSSGIYDNRISYIFNNRLEDIPNLQALPYNNLLLDGDAEQYPYPYYEFLRDLDCLYFPTAESGNTIVKGGATYQFATSNIRGGSPVLYSEISEINADGGFINRKYTNFYSKEGGRHYDEYVTGTSRWTKGFKINEPYSDKSMERGLIISEEIYKADNTPLSKTFNTYKELTDTLFFTKKGERFVKSLTVGNDYIASVSDQNELAKIGNLAVNLVVDVGLDALTGGAWSGVTGVLKTSQMMPKITLFNEATSFCDYYSTYAYPYKKYIYNYGLTKQIAVTYNPNDQTKFVTDSIYYTYNRYYQPSQIRKKLSNGTEFITKMKYVSDYSDGIIPQQRDGLNYLTRTSDIGQYLNYYVCNNIGTCNYTNIFNTQIWNKPELEGFIRMGLTNKISYPVEVQMLRNGKTIGGTINFYRHKLGQLDPGGNDVGGIDALEKTFKMKITPTLAAVTESSINKSNWTFTYDASRYNIKAIQAETGTAAFSTATGNSFTGYDLKGNLLSVTDRSGLNAKMTYDAQNQMTSRYVAGTLGEEAITKTQYVTTPLVGVKEITDPNGKKIRYEYDGFNRIKAVKQVYSDGKEYLLKTYAYHYCNDGSTGAVTIGNFVSGACDASTNPIDCKLSTTIIPTSAMEMGQPVTLVASYDEGATSTSSTGSVSYLWQLPDGTSQTNSTLSQSTPLLGDYVLTVQKGSCKVCLKFTVSTTSLSLVEGN